jgi:aryl-alcohol dehydrogenase-like predicted oxidoreductase
MEQRLLGGTGFSVPALSLGAATFGGTGTRFRAWGNTDAAGAKRLLDVALDAGVTMFDSADSYSEGHSETILGQAIAGRRDRVVVSTKAVFPTGPGPNDQGASRHHLIAACEASLERLGTDYIDLWYMHAFDARTRVEEMLAAQESLVRAGKVRYLGCSNFSGWHLMKSIAVADRYGWPRYAAHQVYYSLLARELEWELMPLALDQQVSHIVFSPLAMGLLTGKFEPGKPAPEGSRVAALGVLDPQFSRKRMNAVIEALGAIAEETGRTIAQVALNWTLHRPTIASVLVGARDETQLKENLGAADFRLDRDQIKRLDEVSARPPAYPYWHQRIMSPQRNPPPV